MFQKQELEGQQLNKNEWTHAVRELGQKWRALGADVRERYEAEAKHEDCLRQEAMRQPFQSKKDKATGNVRLGDAAFDAAADLKRKTMKKISGSRLSKTFAEYEGSKEWEGWNGGIACAAGCLRLDLINMSSTAEEIEEKWASATAQLVSDPAFWASDWKKNQEVHHSVCHSRCGHCASDSHTKVAEILVGSLHQLISKGIWARCSSQAAFGKVCFTVHDACI